MYTIFQLSISIAYYLLQFFYRLGIIEDIGFDSELEGKYSNYQFEQVINASGCCVVPGLIDAHTHPVWAGDRVHEFSMKVR